MHDFFKPIDCGCGQPYCWICDEQLGGCKVCGGLEGSLTMDCPRVRLSEAQRNAVYRAEIDFRGGAWVRPPQFRSRAVLGVVVDAPAEL